MADPAVGARPAPPHASLHVRGVVLAAGQGRRFGGFKAFATLGGETLLGRALTALAGAGVSDRLVIAHPDWAQTPLPNGAVTAQGVPPPRVLANPGWAEGMSTSLRLALGAAPEPDAVVLLVVDTPLVTAACVQRCLSLAGPGALVQATYAGVPGHPVVVGARHFPGLLATLEGDAGARRYLKQQADSVVRVECGDIGSGEDVDTAADLQRLRATFGE
ncbi:MAG: nucleotidyltransferase family protein [Actinomycetales bacterium]